MEDILTKYNKPLKTTENWNESNNKNRETISEVYIDKFLGIKIFLSSILLR